MKTPFDPSGVRYPAPNFPGIEKPSIDFQPVRDQRRALPDYYDVDLSTARSFSAGSALILPIAGNVFFVDQDTTNTGIATVYFQDTTAKSTPLTVGAGSIFRIPFTGLAIENSAQAGKRLRIVYGVDLDFLPALNANVAITGSVSISGDVLTRRAPSPYYDDATMAQDFTNLGVNGAMTMIAPASNTGGAIIWQAESASMALTTPPTGGFGWSSSAPATLSGLQVVAHARPTFQVTTSYGGCHALLHRPIKIPAGYGFYYCNGATAEAVNSGRHILYTLL